MAMTMNKLLIFLLSLLAVSLEAATITNWGAQLPTAAPNGGDVILMQQGGVTYYFTPNQLAANIATNATSVAPIISASNSIYVTETTRNAAVSNGVVSVTISGSTNKIENSSGRGTNTSLYGTNTVIGSLISSNTTATGLILAVYQSNNPTPILHTGSNGVVSIGTNFSSSKLHVRPAMSGQSYFRVDDTNGTARLQFGVYPGVSSYAMLTLGDVVPSAASSFLSTDGTGDRIINARTGGHLYISREGNPIWDFGMAGHLLVVSDNTYDIGASGATRPRNVYIGTSISVATNIAVFAITTNNFALDTYYTNSNQRSWVGASIGMTNVLLTEKAWVGLYLDQDGDGTWERTGINCRLQGVSALAGVEQLTAFLQPNARFIFTNLGTVANASVEANSSQWVRQ